MRKFIISDLHGDKEIYQTMFSYLEEIQKHEDVELYINGDLFDRGLFSSEMLLDIYQKCKEKRFPIIYLAGNHELMMMEAFEERKKGIFSSANKRWYHNGGGVTDKGLTESLKSQEKILEVVDFISNLKIVYAFEETILDQKIVLVHAACPYKIERTKKQRLKDNTDEIFYEVWVREDDPTYPFRPRIGSKDYFTIIGHTPNPNPNGYEYHKKGNYLNIDGGCSYYVCGNHDYDHVPFVEVSNDHLRILTFNHQGEIKSGSYFDGKESVPFTKEELEKENVKIKRR